MENGTSGRLSRLMQLAYNGESDTGTEELICQVFRNEAQTDKA